MFNESDFVPPIETKKCDDCENCKRSEFKIQLGSDDDTKKKTGIKWFFDKLSNIFLVAFALLLVAETTVSVDLYSAFLLFLLLISYVFHTFSE